MLQDPSKLNFWGRLQQKQMASLMAPFQKQQQLQAEQAGREKVKTLMGGRATPYQDEDQMFDSLDTLPEGLKNKGTGLIGGEITPMEYFGELASTQGQEARGHQGLMDILSRQTPTQKPTGLMQNLAAAGYERGTPEYQQAVKDYLSKANTQINMGTKHITGAEAQMMRNDRQEMPPIGMSHEQAGAAGFHFIDKEAEKKARDREETLGSMGHSLDTYERILKKQGAMNITQMFTDPAEYTQLQGAYGDLLLETKELAKLGVLAGPDMDLMAQLMIDPTSLKANVMQFSSSKDELPKQLSIIRSKLEQARKRAVQQYGKNWRAAVPKDTVRFEDLP